MKTGKDIDFFPSSPVVMNFDSDQKNNKLDTDGQNEFFSTGWWGDRDRVEALSPWGSLK